MRLGLCFQGFLALLWFLIIKSFNLKHLVGERYKGWISRPPLSVYSSVGKHLVLTYMPCNPKGGCFVPWYYKFKHYKGDEMWLHMILDNGVH